jgi:hypothetical protein
MPAALFHLVLPFLAVLRYDEEAETIEWQYRRSYEKQTKEVTYTEDYGFRPISGAAGGGRGHLPVAAAVLCEPFLPRNADQRHGRWRPYGR